MKLQDQVCSLVQAKRLKELGINQESLFSWFGDEEMRLRDNGAAGAEYSQWLFVSETKPVNNQEADWRADVGCKKPIAAAFTVAELGVMLPNGYDTMRIKSKDSLKVSVWQGYDDDGNDFTVEPFKTEAECRAEMIIYMLDTKLITPDEVNARLCS